MKIEIVDLDFMNTGQVIAAFLLLGEDGSSAALVETGPTTCLDRLTAGLKDSGVSYEDVQQVYLTHVHLDHAGASGHLSELLANATFYVNEVAYPHLADPSKLVKRSPASTARGWTSSGARRPRARGQDQNPEGWG